MFYLFYGNRIKWKRKNSNLIKNVRYKVYESLNKDLFKMVIGGGELVNEVNREGSECSVINDGEFWYLLILNDEVIEIDFFLRLFLVYLNIFNWLDWVNEIFIRFLYIE